MQPHVSQAFKAACKIIGETLSPSFKWDPLELEAAKSSLIFEEVEDLKSVPGAMSEALDNALEKVPLDFMK